MRRLTLAAAFAAVVAVGCGGEQSIGLPNPVPAGGKLTTADGKPVADVLVFLQPLTSPVPANGTTGPDGSFTLQTYDAKPGAVAGKYRVIIKVAQGDPKIDFKKSQAAVKAVPAKYTEENSPLEIEIPAGGATDLALKLDK